VYPSRYGSNPFFPQPSDFRVVKRDHNSGFGVICFRTFEPGEIVAALAGEIVTEVGQHTLQIKPGMHLLDLDFCGYFLHSCDPNVDVDMEKMIVRAIRKISANDYILMDYSQTEDILYKQFPCHCGAANCRGWITGRLEDSDQSDLRYQEFLQSRNALLLSREK
jgi:hypothetical protein